MIFFAEQRERCNADTMTIKQSASVDRHRERTPSAEGPPALFDPRRGDEAFRLGDLNPVAFVEPKRFNYFTIFFVREGSGVFHTDAFGHPYGSALLLFFNPYQTFHLLPESPHEGTTLQFHANFFCLEAHHEAVGCNGVLFNDIYGLPLVKLAGADVTEVSGLMENMARELATGGIASPELLISYLKVLLIKATRLKLDQQGSGALLPGQEDEQSSVCRELQRLIEAHYRTLHRPSQYAALLAITPKKLGKLVKRHFHKTPTELIRERLLKEAKWQLLHTRRPVKEIAAEVGFEDEFYFSRLFRRAIGYSPTYYREYETVIRGGSNLSMEEESPSIP